MQPAPTATAPDVLAAESTITCSGGKDNFVADRKAAERTAAAVSQAPWLARQNRKFLGRAVRFCASAGITQFLDIGSGLPTMQNVHQVAEQVITDPHVVYADHSPVVVSRARALLTTPADRGRPRGATW